MYQQFESGRLDHRNRAIHLVQIGFRNVSHQQSRHNGSGGTSGCSPLLIMVSTMI
jgi:hypothetical protein